jgi:hypothetical protein
MLLSKLNKHVQQAFICGTEKAHCHHAVERVNVSKCGTHGTCLDREHPK